MESRMREEDVREEDDPFRLKPGRFCSVYGCFNRSNKNRSFFRFPSDKYLRRAWVRATGREGFEPTEFSRVCSEHFQKQDFCNMNKAILRKLSYPTVFNECVERPFPKFSHKTRTGSSSKRMLKTESGTNPYLSYMYPQGLGNTEHTTVKQEVLSDEDESDRSNVAFYPLLELITKLRSKLPKTMATTTTTTQNDQTQVDEVEMPLPVITPVINVRAHIKPDPDDPNQFRTDEGLDNIVPDDPNQFRTDDDFVASSLVDCQLEDDEPTIRIAEVSSMPGTSASAPESKLCYKCDSCSYTCDQCHPSSPNGCCPESCCERPVTSATAVLPTGISTSTPDKTSVRPPGDYYQVKFQKYGKVVGERLNRLKRETALLVQTVIEELMFNAEDGQYDDRASKDGILRKRKHYSKYKVVKQKQVAGFNQYED